MLFLDANGYSATAYGDKYGQTILTKEGSVETESREYDAQGKIKKYIDNVSGIEYKDEHSELWMLCLIHSRFFNLKA